RPECPGFRRVVPGSSCHNAAPPVPGYPRQHRPRPRPPRTAHHPHRPLRWAPTSLTPPSSSASSAAAAASTVPGPARRSSTATPAAHRAHQDMALGYTVLGDCVVRCWGGPPAPRRVRLALGGTDWLWGGVHLPEPDPKDRRLPWPT